MAILSEPNFQTRILTESTDSGKKWYIEGVYIQCDVMNRNKRIYPLSVMQESVDRYRKEFLDNDQAVGELEHPSGRLEVHHERISHKIVKLEEDGSNFYGKALILNTPCGKIIQGLLEGGVKIGLSTRGGGQTKPIAGGEEVLPGFRLFAIDSVFHPSAQTAYMDALMEGENFIWDTDNADVAYLESIKESIKKTNKRMLEEAKAKAFSDFISRLKA